MSRTLDATMTTALQAQKQEIFWLFEIEFSSGTVRYCTAQHNIVWGGEEVTPAGGTDAFTEASNVNLDAHTPDTGITAWEYNGASADVIVDATEDAARFTLNGGNFVRSTNDLIPTDWLWYIECRVLRNSVDGTTESAGLYGYAESTVAAASIVGEGFQLYVVRGSSANVGNIVIDERNSAGTVTQTTTLVSGISWAPSTDIYLRAEVDGLNVTCLWRASVSDPWTDLGIFTLGIDVRDADHRRVGIVGNDGSQVSSSEPFVDDFEFGELVSVSRTWTGIGGHLTLDAVEESPDRQTGVNLTLDGVDTSVIALILGANYLGRQATLYYGLMGTDGAIVVDPIQFGPYYMLSSWNVRENRSDDGSGTATVRGRLTSRLAPLAKVKGIVTNVRSHEKHYSGDVFFEHVPNLVGKQIIWGGQGTKVGGGGNRGGGGRNGGDEGPGGGDILV